MAILLVVVTGCGYFGEAKLVPSSDDLKKEFVQSESDFTKKYNGKEVAYWGKVATITNLGDRAYLYMTSDVSGGTDIRCVVAKADMDKFSLLKIEHDTIASVRGTVSVEKEGVTVVEVRSCKAIKVGIANTEEK